MADDAVILLVEDREDDILVIEKALKKGGIDNPLQVVRDGEEAMSYLAGEGRYSNRAEYPLPDLVLLDLKLPRYDGFEVLRWIRRQPGFRSLRVIVLTSSEAIRDVNMAYTLGANSFMGQAAGLRECNRNDQAVKNLLAAHGQEPSVKPARKSAESIVYSTPAPTGKSDWQS